MILTMKLSMGESYIVHQIHFQLQCVEMTTIIFPETSGISANFLRGPVFRKNISSSEITPEASVILG